MIEVEKGEVYLYPVDCAMLFGDDRESDGGGWSDPPRGDHYGLQLGK